MSESSQKSAEVCRNNAIKAVDESAAEVLCADDTPGVYKMPMVRMCGENALTKH